MTAAYPGITQVFYFDAIFDNLKSKYIFDLMIDHERVRRELSIAHNNRVETCREGTRSTPGNSWEGVEG